jgi:hypothetical protein
MRAAFTLCVVLLTAGVSPAAAPTQSSTLTINMSDVIWLDMWKVFRTNAAKWCLPNRTDVAASFKAAEAFESFTDLATCWLMLGRKTSVYVGMESTKVAGGRWQIKALSDARFKGGSDSVIVTSPFTDKVYKVRAKVIPITIRNDPKAPTATLLLNYSIQTIRKGVSVRTEWFLPDYSFWAIGVESQELRLRRHQGTKTAALPTRRGP